jgi:hypothetical protein
VTIGKVSFIKKKLVLFSDMGHSFVISVDWLYRYVEMNISVHILLCYLFMLMFFSTYSMIPSPKQFQVIVTHTTHTTVLWQSVMTL